MKSAIIYLLWAISIILLIASVATLLEAMWNIRVHHYVINLVILASLVALHYLKFRKSQKQ